MNLLKKLVNKQIFCLIIFLSIILRFIGINQSLWLDEAIGALVVKSQSYLGIVTQFPLGDNHPPLYYLKLKAWTDIFGYSEFALRSLSVVFGILTIVFVYKTAILIDEK
ncbi:glycosyltransferase family 39 protein, partial [Patescibacteria group bacterium]|nr:glycosyltransferase family 39 protein [Patescibacteria group bacterium]